MAVDIVMPQMGESIFEGTITKWLKKPGDKVERDEPLFEISTDKVDAEIPSPSAGVLKEIKVGEGKTVPIQTVVGVIDAASDGAAPPATALPRLRLPLRHPHRKLRNPQGLPLRHLPRSLRLRRRRRKRQKPLLLLPLLPPGPAPRHRALPANASTARRSSAAWPRSTALISLPCRVPALAAASANKTSKRILPVAPRRRRNLVSPAPRNMRHLRPLRSAPPGRPRRLLSRAARCTWLSSPPCRAKKCTSAITKCSP